MSKRLRAITLVVATFALGILVGALVNGAIAERQSRAFRARPVGPLFADIIENIVKPNAEQRDSMKGVLDRYSKTLTAELEVFGERMSQITDSLKQELSPLLTSEQRERLTEGLLPPPRRIISGFGHEVEILKEELGLSERQLHAIRSIYDDMRREMEALAEGDRRDPRSRREKMVKIGRNVQDRIKAVLSPEQREKFDKIRESFPRRAISGGPGFIFRGEPGMGIGPDSTFFEKKQQ